MEADQPSAAKNNTTAETSENDNKESSKPSSGCPVKAESRASWNILRRGNNDTSKTQQQQYDVYSRPLPMDPTNNMPIPNAQTTARNNLPNPDQRGVLPTERVKSTIPKGNTNETWVYPSPQMFYNALARKGKLSMPEDESEDKDEAGAPAGIEEDMESVVAIHNCMNEGTWSRILQWEKVLNPVNNDKNSSDNSNEEGVTPKLLKFCGRPTDLSPKAFFKHYLLSHPLPFDRHDWTVARTNPTDGSETQVRYVIDYYHDEVMASEEAGSGLPQMNDGIGDKGKIKSLLVDVRPAADSLSEVYGRMVSMPLARRGCRSILECVLFKGHGSGRNKVEFEPLPLMPSETLKESLGESKKVWEGIQRDAANKKGVGAKDGGGDACASDSLEGEGEKKVESSSPRSDISAVDANAAADEAISKPEATKMAETFSKILSQCKDSKAALQSCSSEEECNKAFMGMTVCAGQYMCPLQHKSLLDTLDSISGSDVDGEMAEAKINVAMEVLGECVAKYDKRAGMAKAQHEDIFQKVTAQKS